MDNFGEVFAGIFTPTVNKPTRIVNLIDSSGTPRTVDVYDGISDTCFNDSQAGFMQVGKGTAPVTRQDEDIEVPFSNGGIEDSRFSNPTGGYNSVLGKVSISGQLSPTFGAGTITEVCKFNRWNGFFFLIYHDLVAGVGFIATEQINVTYEVFV